MVTVIRAWQDSIGKASAGQGMVGNGVQGV